MTQVPQRPEYFPLLKIFSLLFFFHKHILCVFGAVGAGDIQGCGCGVHGGGAGAAGPVPEKTVPRRDSGELLEPGLSG